MRRMTPVALLAAVALAGCMDEGGDGYITHSDHRLSSAERASIQAGLQQATGEPVAALSGLQATYVLANGSTAVCGYLVPAGKLPSLFGGTIKNGVFTIFRAPGRGQDPQRIAQVRAFCASQQITI